MKYISGACYMFAAFSLGILLWYHGESSTQGWVMGVIAGIIIGSAMNYSAEE